MKPINIIRSSSLSPRIPTKAQLLPISDYFEMTTFKFFD